MVDVIVHYNNNPFWISADTSKDGPECAIPPNVRIPEDASDLRMLWLSELTA